MRIIYSDSDGCLNLRQPFFFIFIFAILISCNQSRELPELGEDVLFNVNGIERTTYEFEAEYVEYLIKTGRNDTKTERYAFLNEMIDNLLLAQAGSEVGLLDDPTYLGALYYQERKSMLDYYFVDEMEKLLDPISDDDLRLAFAKRKRSVFVRQLYSIDPLELVQPYQRLLNGENFVDVANDFYETEQYDSLAGYIGPINYFGVEDAFAEAAYSTNLNEFTEPVRTRYGYHIIYVDYIEFPAMLTEDEYQYRKSGVESQLKLRRQQLVSNDFVRTLMEGLAVLPNVENINALKEVIDNLDGQAIINSNRNPENNLDNVWTDDRIEQLATAFDKDAVMASYDKNGTRVDFTFGDYLSWLPYLSFQESKSRIGASIGRGLRNEVIYQLAEENNYVEDDRVKDAIEKRGYEILSDLHQFNLVQTALSDTSKVIVPNSYRDRLISSRNFLLKAEYWKILARDLSEAEQIKENVAFGDLPLSYDTFQKFEYSTIDPNEDDYTLVEKSILESPIIGYSESEGWMVINVLRRDLTEISNTTSISDIETNYKVYNAIFSEVGELRDAANIRVDTLLFNDIYEVWRQNNEEASNQ